MLNKVLQIGRLTRDPEIRFLPSGTQVTGFSIAVNRAYKTKDSDEWKEETYYFDVETFGNLAERLGKQLTKGKQVLVEGSLRQDRWENKEGEKRSKIKIVAEKVSLIGNKKAESSSAPEETVTVGVEGENSDEVPF